MNIQVMSVLHLHSMMCYKWQIPSNLMQSIHLGRKMLLSSVQSSLQSLDGSKRRKLTTKTSMGQLLEQTRERASKCGPIVALPSSSSQPSQKTNLQEPQTESTTAVSSCTSASPSVSKNDSSTSSALQSALAKARKQRRDK